MIDLISDWQQALVELLSQDEPDGLGFTFLAMRRDGLSKERDIGCIFPGDPAFSVPDSGHSAFANYRMTIRAWRRFKAEPSQDKQPDPGPVNELATALATVLQPMQTTLLTGRMYFLVEQTRLDYPALGVEMQLRGWALNPAAIPVP